jgi:thiosulfate dehydrogenase
MSNKGNTHRSLRDWLFAGGLMTAGIALGALFVVTGHAHKEKHTLEELAFFEQAFMEQVIIGDRLFHGDKALEEEMGINLSNTGMACAMCHPFASDVHPHEFPKFQEQMSAFATLRDMTNWCIDKPNEGEMIPVDSDAMKALEAYMYWSNRGSVLDPGRH